MSQSEPHFVSIPEAADQLACSRSRLYELMAEGTLHPVKFGRRTVLSTAELRDFAARRAISAGVPADVYDEPEAVGASR